MDGLDRSEPPPTVNDNMPRREMVLWINSARLVELLAFSPKFEICGQRKSPGQVIWPGLIVSSVEITRFAQG